MITRFLLRAAALPPVMFGLTQPAMGQTAPDAPIETVVVTGTRATMESERAEIELTPGGVGLIDIDSFRESNVSSLADVLRYVPGMWSTSDSGNDEIFFSSRGSNLDATDYDMNGIKLLQDGLPVTTADGNNHNRIVDPLAARYAVVARGANALKYGASTLGGAINFVSPTAHDGTGLDMAINGGSHGQLAARVTAAQIFNERLDGILTLEGKQWDGYREHNEQRRVGLYANAGWQLSPAVSTRFYGAYLSNDQELPGALTRAELDADPGKANASAVGGNFQVDVDTFRLANKTVWELEGERQLELGFSIEEQSLFHPIVDRVMVDFDGPGPAPAVEVFSLLVDTDHRDIGSMARYRQRVGAHDLLLGLNFGHNAVDGGNYRNLGGLPNGLTTRIDNRATQLELFAMDRWSLSERLSIIFAAQSVSADRDVRNTDAVTNVLDNPKASYSQINPRIGIIYAPRDELSLYANASRLFEAPTNYELQDNVAGGDATLDPMTGTVIEIGTRGGGDFGARASWAWDLSYYYARIDDEILSVEDPAAPGTSLVTNIDATIHSGVEGVLSASIGLGSGRSIEPLVSFTLNDFRFDGDPVYGDNRLAAAPDYFVRGELIYRSATGFYAGPTFELVGKRYADFANAYAIDSYGVLGIRGGWSSGPWTFFADLRNVLDESYVANHAVRNVAGPEDALLNPGEPASAYFGVIRMVD